MSIFQTLTARFESQREQIPVPERPERRFSGADNGDWSHIRIRIALNQASTFREFSRQVYVSAWAHFYRDWIAI